MKVASIVTAAIALTTSKSTSTVVAQEVTFQDALPTSESFEEVTWISLLHYASSIHFLITSSYVRNNQYGPSAASVFDGYAKPLTVEWDLGSEQGTDVLILAAPESERIYLSFRGTDGEGSDFETDLNFDLVPYGDSSSSAAFTFSEGRVHEGFNTNLFGGTDKLYVTLDSQVRSVAAKYGTYRVTVMGHSLGGALAILYGAHVAKNVLPDNDVSVQTIGTPRVGDETFKSSIRELRNLANFRLVYRRDVISRIPLETQGYRHAGHLIFLHGSRSGAYFEQGGDLEKYAGIGADDFLLPTALDERLALPVFHHLPWSYLEGLADAKTNGWWPTEFVPFSRQEKVCCGWFLGMWCRRRDFPPC